MTYLIWLSRLLGGAMPLFWLVFIVLVDFVALSLENWVKCTF